MHTFYHPNRVLESENADNKNHLTIEDKHLKSYWNALILIAKLFSEIDVNFYSRRRYSLFFLFFINECRLR